MGPCAESGRESCPRAPPQFRWSARSGCISRSTARTSDDLNLLDHSDPPMTCSLERRPASALRSGEQPAADRGRARRTLSTHSRCGPGSPNVRPGSARLPPRIVVLAYRPSSPRYAAQKKKNGTGELSSRKLRAPPGSAPQRHLLGRVGRGGGSSSPGARAAGVVLVNGPRSDRSRDTITGVERSAPAHPPLSLRLSAPAMARGHGRAALVRLSCNGGAGARWSLPLTVGPPGARR